MKVLMTQAEQTTANQIARLVQLCRQAVEGLKFNLTEDQLEEMDSYFVKSLNTLKAVRNDRQMSLSDLQGAESAIATINALRSQVLARKRETKRGQNGHH